MNFAAFADPVATVRGSDILLDAWATKKVPQK